MQMKADCEACNPLQIAAASGGELIVTFQFEPGFAKRKPPAMNITEPFPVPVVANSDAYRIFEIGNLMLDMVRAGKPK